MTLAKTERAALADLFAEVGPDRPTLDEGWTTQDLLSHLLVRERKPIGALGGRISLFQGQTRKDMAAFAEQPWAEQVELYRGGPPTWNPTGWGKLDDLTNGGEMFIHHEDVRRGEPGWEPRDLPEADRLELIKTIDSAFTRFAMKGSGVGLTAVITDHPDGAEHRIKLSSGVPEAVVRGAAGEIVLWVSGRDATRVEFFGDSTAISKAQATKRGL